MHPFFELPFRTVPAYGVMILLGITAGAGLVFLLCKLTKTAPADPLLAGCIAVAGAMIGALSLRPLMKLPEVMLRWEDYRYQTAEAVVNYVFGEMVFFGGLLGGIVTLFIYCRAFRLPVLTMADTIAPALALGHGLGRIGCLLGGCCYGMKLPAHHPLAIVYPPESLAAPPGVPLFAAPAVEAGFLFVLALVLALLYPKLTKRPGVLLGLYFLLYSIERYIIEFFRGDIVRGQYGPFTTSQYIAMTLFAAGLALLLRKKLSK